MLGKEMPRIKDVEVSGPSKLTLKWMNGGKSEVDLVGWIKLGGEQYMALLDPRVFETAKVIDHGVAIGWDVDDVEIDNTHLGLIAEQQAPMSSSALKKWQDEMGVSNQEAADLVGVGLSTWNTFRAGQAKVPPAVTIALRVMKYDPVVFSAHLRPRRTGRPRGSAVAEKQRA